MTLRMPYLMSAAPLHRKATLLNNVDASRYTVEVTGTLEPGGRELWLVRKAPGPRGSAGALYRVTLPLYKPRVLPADLRGVAECNCPEFAAGARRLGGVCKHILMAYAWQGAYAGIGARWFYLDVYLAQYSEEEQHG